MGRVLMKMYYTDVVEHYFRLAVRSPTIRDRVSEAWQATTRKWISTLSNEDKSLLRKIFKYENRTTEEGLLSLDYDYQTGKTRLRTLEREFAKYIGLISQEDEDNEKK